MSKEDKMTSEDKRASMVEDIIAAPLSLIHI